MSKRPHVEYLAQYIEGDMKAPDVGGKNTVSVDVLLDSIPGLASISEVLFSKL